MKLINRISPLARFVIAALLLFAFSFSATFAKKKKDHPHRIHVNAVGISFSVMSQKKYGALKWLGGLNISSNFKDFGGFSGLTLSADGQKMLAITDRGHWLKADLIYKNNILVGLKNTSMDQLRSRKGKKLKRKNTQDAESIALLSGDLTDGYALIGFERVHRIGKFKIKNGLLSNPDYYLKLPRKMRAASRNKGLEAITILKKGLYKGAVVVIPERLKNRRGNLKGWILTKTGSHRMTFKRRGGFDVTDLAALPDGSMLVLERRFKKPKGFLAMLSNNIIKMRIRHIAEKDIRPGKLLDGKILLEANRRFRIDNMEGLATHINANGDQILTLISDDNFSALQDTLLLQFILPKQ